MKAVIVLLALVALAYCQAPPGCGTYITLNAPTDGWSGSTPVNQTIGTPVTQYLQCWAINATNPDSTVDNSLVIAGRFDESSQTTNYTFLAVWNVNFTVNQQVNITNEDDVDSICYKINTTNPDITTAAGQIWFGVFAVSENTTVDIWTQITDEPSCGPDADLSGSSSFWVWIIVAVVIVVIIAVIIAGAGAFVYYQKKKKGQAKLYEDS